MFCRAQVQEKGMERAARVGDGWLANPRVVTNAAAGNQDITINAILGGVALFTGAAGAVTYQMPTAAAIIAAMPDMDIGDSYVFEVTNTAAQTATLNNAAVGVTFAGFSTVNAGTRTGIITRTGAATVSVTFI